MQLFEKKIVDIVHQLFMEYVHEGDIVIDATAGGGQDTLKLCECVGSTGKVYAFDIQQEALTSAARLLDQYGMGDRAQLILDSHHHLDLYVHEEVKAFVFNLGYFPKGSHNVITKTDTTAQALQKCLNLLEKGGLGVVVAYCGHEGGQEEKNCVDNLLQMLPAKSYDVWKLESHNRANHPPVLYMLRRKK